VNDDGQIAPIDALRLVNELNLRGPGDLPPYRNVALHPDFLDVSGDGYFTSLDALLVINVLNELFDSVGEGEAAVTLVPVAPLHFLPSDGAGHTTRTPSPEVARSDDWGFVDDISATSRPAASTSAAQRAAPRRLMTCSSAQFDFPEGNIARVLARYCPWSEDLCTLPEWIRVPLTLERD
jgi:hypothetical protein